MNRTFIEVPTFTRKWKELGLTDDNLRELQKILLDNPRQEMLFKGQVVLEKYGFH